MSTPQQRLRLYHRTYLSALHEYLRDPSEGSLTVAYELGRAAVTQQLSVLDVAVAYHQGLSDALTGASGQDERTAITRDGGEFFLESLASFEMLHRGAAEARQSVKEHRHRAQLSRQLSTFLTDSSLAFQSADSIDEMLQLAVDQGREILGAGCCLVTVATADESRAAEAVSAAAPESDWAFTRWLDLPEVYRWLQEGEECMKPIAEREGLSALPAAPATGLLPRDWLAASLTALDGTLIGALQAFGSDVGTFDSEDEAVLIHLAQMISATVERMRLYGQTAFGGSPPAWR